MDLLQLLVLLLYFALMWWLLRTNIENFANKLLANNIKVMREYLQAYNDTLKALHNLEQSIDKEFEKQHNHNSKTLN